MKRHTETKVSALRVTAETAPYVTPAQLAAMLQVSPKTVYRWATQDPTMPVLRIGGVVRFPTVRIVAWLRSREQGQGRPAARPGRRPFAIDKPSAG